jgi:predicted nucleic acid-binding protein
MIIVDTGFWVALANKNDNSHEAAKMEITRRCWEERREKFNPMS